MKTIGRAITLILAGSLLIFFISWAYAQENIRPISIVIDGRELSIQDQRPFTENNRIMVPLRLVAEGLGAAVGWQNSSQTVTVAKGDKEIALTVDELWIRINQQIKPIDVPARLTSQKRIVVPLRVINEALGYQVDWDSAASTVRITTAPQPIAETPLQVQEPAVGKLRAIRLGATEADIEKLLGNPVRKEPGAAQTTWWIYHQNYEQYWQIAFQEGKVVMIYTNDKNVELNQIAIGSSREQILSSFGNKGAKYNDGNLTIEANPSSGAEYIIVANGNEFIKFYLDVHDSNRVSGLRIFDPILLLQGYGISGYKSSLMRGSYQDYVLPTLAPVQQELINRSQELQLFDLVNVSRVKAGLGPLKWHSVLATVAYRHSEDMDKNKYFSHTSLNGKSPFDRMKDGGVKYVSAAENIAMGTFDAIEAHHGLMNSLGHRKNIIHKDFTHLGVGVFNNNSIYFTQKFIKQ